MENVTFFWQELIGKKILCWTFRKIIMNIFDLNWFQLFLMWQSRFPKKKLYMIFGYLFWNRKLLFCLVDRYTLIMDPDFFIGETCSTFRYFWESLMHKNEKIKKTWNLLWKKYGVFYFNHKVRFCIWSLVVLLDKIPLMECKKNQKHVACNS